MSLTKPPPLAPRWPFFPWVRRRLLTMLTDLSCGPLCVLWALAPLSFLGLICFTIGFRVRSMLMEICRLSLAFLVVCGRVVPRRLCSMSWSPRCWRSTFAVTPAFLVSVFLGHFHCLQSLSIVAAFEMYALFEQASGSKLNQSKSKGLWLGGWCCRVDPLVALDWSSSKLKVLGVFMGFFMRRSVSGLLGCQFLSLAFLGLLWNPWSIFSFCVLWLRVFCLGFNLCCLLFPLCV